MLQAPGWKPLVRKYLLPVPSANHGSFPLLICACHGHAGTGKGAASEVDLDSYPLDRVDCEDDDLSSHPVDDCTDYEDMKLNTHSGDAQHSTAKLQCHALEFDEETEEDWQYMRHEGYEQSVGDNTSAIDRLQLEEEAEEEWLSMYFAGPTPCNATTTDKR